jgi:hypothetical protein
MMVFLSKEGGRYAKGLRMKSKKSGRGDASISPEIKLTGCDPRALKYFRPVFIFSSLGVPFFLAKEKNQKICVMRYLLQAQPAQENLRFVPH